MNGLGAIAFGVGLQDGLNPCIFMTTVLFVTHGLLIRQNSVAMGWLRFIFVIVYAMNFLEFNFGPSQVYVLSKDFVFVAKIIYFALSLYAVVGGAVFLKDWFLLHRRQPIKEPTGIKFLAGNSSMAVLATVILAVFLSALATTLQPVNSYILILGNVAFLKGQWQEVILILGNYVFSSMWPLLFVWAIFSIKGLRESLVKIVSAAVFFTASTCMFLVFAK